MFNDLYQRVASIWAGWTDHATQEQKRIFWNHAEELKEHTVQMYELAEDASKDVIAMAMIANSIVKQLFFHPGDTRKLTAHSLQDCQTPEDLATYAITSDDA